MALLDQVLVAGRVQTALLLGGERHLALRAAEPPHLGVPVARLVNSQRQGLLKRLRALGAVEGAGVEFPQVDRQALGGLQRRLTFRTVGGRLDSVRQLVGSQHVGRPAEESARVR